MNAPKHKEESDPSKPASSLAESAAGSRWTPRLLFGLGILSLPVTALVCWLYYTHYTPTGKFLRQFRALKSHEDKVLNRTNHEALRDACRKVISDPKVFPTQQLLSSDPSKGKDCKIAPSDPQLPAVIRSLEAKSVVVLDDVMIINLRTHWSFSSLVVFQQGVENSHGYSRGRGHMRVWKELAEGLYYSAGDH